MKRRTLLKSLGVMGTAGLALPRLAHAATAAISGKPFAQPTELVAEHGVLNFTTAVRYGRYDLYGNKVHLRGFDGQPTGKTLRVKAGDRLNFSMINVLPKGTSKSDTSTVEQEAGTTTVAAMQSSHMGHGGGHGGHGRQIHARANSSSNALFNTTNLHVHGVHVSPDKPSDYVLMQIDPGDYFHYHYDIPADHPPGTYFYHPHYHGAVGVQVASGMAGAIIIEGEVDQIPEIAHAAEKVMVFQSPAFDSKGELEANDTLFTIFPLTVNGLLQPVLSMRPGEVQRWRMVNGTFEETITLSLLPEGGTTALPLTVLCTDGNPLSKATSVSSLYLAGGNRADVLVKAPSQPGTYQLHYGYTDKNKQPATQKAMTIKVEGPAKEMPLFAGRLPSVPLLKPIVDSEIVRTRTLTYGLNSDKLFTVNGVTFGSDQPQQDVILGTAEEWTITDTTGFPHSFHIHVNPFQATSSPVHPIIEPGQWLDTIEVPPNGSVTFRTRFTDYTGTFVLHCHYLPHEDAGLMQVVNVLPPTSAK